MRQYIGARYVPKFRGTFDQTTQYDALDVVDNGAGTSYIARKPVPVNTPLTNTEYWFVYGASSGAILDLQSRMTAAEGAIEDLEDEVDAKDIYIAVGDSYAVNGNLFSNLELPDDVTLISNSLGGASFAKADMAGMNSYKLCLEQLTDSDIGDLDKVKKVFILGGINDAADATESYIESGVALTMVYIHTRFKNAEVIWFPCGMPRSQRPTYYLRNNRVIAAVNANGGISCVNARWILMHYTTDWESDGIHPSSSGYAKIKGYIPAGMLKGYIDVEEFFYDDGLKTPGGANYSVSGTLYAVHKNDTIHVYSSQIDIGAGTQLNSGSGSTGMALCELSSSSPVCITYSGQAIGCEYPFVQTSTSTAQGLQVIQPAGINALNIANPTNGTRAYGPNNGAAVSSIMSLNWTYSAVKTLFNY